ncbi:MAG: hypothetical protein O3C56_07840 [Bacteroidetes bacterium]|nr:hypothetical protein [Bacteroidota bacterium]
MNTEFQINDQAIGYLKETQKWTHFLSIFGFVISGILLLFSILIGTILNVFVPFEQTNEFINPTRFSVIYLVIAIGCFVLYSYLYRFSTRLKQALKMKDNNLLNQSFKFQKSYWKFTVILTIVFVGAYVVIGIVALIISMAKIY